jgi:hypothetical protein
MSLIIIREFRFFQKLSIEGAITQINFDWLFQYRKKNHKSLVRIGFFDIILLLPSGPIQLLPANTKKKVLLFPRIFHTKVIRQGMDEFVLQRFHLCFSFVMKQETMCLSDFAF